MRALLAALLLVVTWPMAAAVAHADEPARTAPYRTTANFRFFGDEDVEGTLDRLADSAEEHLARLCTPIGACGRLTRPIDVWVAADAERFAASFPEPNPMSEWAAGVTFLEQQRIVLRRDGTAVLSLAETFDHEVAHVLAQTFATPGQLRALPRWFSEGLAIWQAGEALSGRLQEAMVAASTGHLLTFEELDRSFPNQGTRVGIAYAQSALFVQRLARRAGPATMAALLHDIGDGVPFADAFTKRFGESPASLFEKAQDDLEKTSTPFTLFADGNLIWTLMTVLFLFAAWWRLRDRKRQMARLSESEDRRIAEEDMALIVHEPPRPPEDDPKLWN
ncbi:MAG: peptidase MA family metallohydrolase [Myxococcota bacterium]